MIPAGSTSALPWPKLAVEALEGDSNWELGGLRDPSLDDWAGFSFSGAGDMSTLSVVCLTEV